eukprot:scaffold88965_cov45-Cyclotella_meneghiniana.AAC.1
MSGDFLSGDFLCDGVEDDLDAATDANVEDFLCEDVEDAAPGANVSSSEPEMSGVVPPLNGLPNNYRNKQLDKDRPPHNQYHLSSLRRCGAVLRSRDLDHASSLADENDDIGWF